MAMTAAETRLAPAPVAALAIPGQGSVDFIPKNREARVILLGGEENLALLPIAGVYHVRRDASGTYVQGEPMANGTVSLRFGFRAKRLPAGLAEVDLAVLHEAIARPLREGNCPLSVARTPARGAPTRRGWVAGAAG